MPLWKLRIPTFSAQKPEEKAAEGPTFQMPAPEEVTTDEAAEPNQKLELPSNVGLAAYQIGSGFVDPSYIDPSYNAAPSAAVDSLALPPAESSGGPALGPSYAVPELPPNVEVDLPMPSDPSSPIGQAIAAGETGETAPLEEETVSWYQVPWNWVTRGWDNHAQLGLDGSSGNSPTLAFQMGMELKRKTDRYTLRMDFDYRKASASGVTTEDNGRYNLDYDQLFNDSKWSAFGKFGAEWDQFKAFDSRLNVNSGLGYHFLRSDDASLSTKFGAGASQEIGAPDDAWKPEAVFGVDGEYQLNRYNKMKARVDFFPAWEDFSDYRMVTDLAWEILLDDKDNLSLKLALTDRYDSTPQGAKPNDIYYSLLLLVKF
jgi:putative salt-induced outer membrane protein YdiY